MFDYTRAACTKIQRDFAKLRKTLEVFIQCLYILYIIYALCANVGNRIINGCFLAYALAYFGFYVYAVKHAEKKSFLAIFKWIKRSIKLANLGIMLYGLACSIQQVSVLTIIFSSLTIVAWIIDVFLGLIGLIIDAWLSYLLEGIDADLDNSKIIRRLVGHEVDSSQEPSEKRQLLSNLVEENRQAKAQKKQDKKERRKQNKVLAKIQKKQEKQDKKTAKRNPAHSVSGEIAVSKDDK